MPARYRAVFFDAFNTLIFPKVGDLAADLVTRGYPITAEDFYAAERAGKDKQDSWLLPRLTGSKRYIKPETVFWVEFIRVLAQRLDAPWTARVRFISLVLRAFRTLEFWTRVEPCAVTFFEELRAEGYRLGVISNATGKMRQQLTRLGLANHFDFILDSSVVGVEKPNPAIFRMGLEAARVNAFEVLFVGDNYSVDIAGARNAGIHGVLFDSNGAYAHRHIDCGRIASIMELRGVLECPADCEIGFAGALL